MVQANLCIIENNGKVLLKLATRGVSKGKWNFPGGKADPGETIEKATVREAYEETGLMVEDLKKLAELSFYEEGKLAWAVYVYKTGKFSGELRETEEGPLKWFDAESMPFDLMWEDDRFWVPDVMKGRKVEGHFYFGKGLTGLMKKEVREGRF